MCGMLQNKHNGNNGITFPVAQGLAFCRLSQAHCHGIKQVQGKNRKYSFFYIACASVEEYLKIAGPNACVESKKLESVIRFYQLTSVLYTYLSDCNKIFQVLWRSATHPKKFLIASLCTGIPLSLSTILGLLCHDCGMARPERL